MDNQHMSTTKQFRILVEVDGVVHVVADQNDFHMTFTTDNTGKLILVEGPVLRRRRGRGGNGSSRR